MTTGTYLRSAEEVLEGTDCLTLKFPRTCSSGADIESQTAPKNVASKRRWFQTVSLRIFEASSKLSLSYGAEARKSSRVEKRVAEQGRTRPSKEHGTGNQCWWRQEYNAERRSRAGRALESPGEALISANGAKIVQAKLNTKLSDRYSTGWKEVQCSAPRRIRSKRWRRRAKNGFALGNKK